MCTKKPADEMTVPELDLARHFSEVNQLPLSKDTRDFAVRDLELFYQGRVGKKPNWLRIWAFNYGLPIPQQEPEYTGA